ncbi:MAG TPA: gamma carbonic anhydrase family protein [Candidatus Thermoplasmatota archaeon]|nr:gamma carbonic anhydrase family protein [Candidatus Thermoplasmatota archaeon]
MIWLAPSAVVTGDVTIGDETSVWHHATLRGDTEAIVIGRQTNIQDNVVVHVDEGAPCRIGNRVVVGHGAIVHGCTVDDEVTIGMGAIITTGAHIGEQSFIGAGAVVSEGTKIPPRSIALGVPAKVHHLLQPHHLERIRHGWRNYLELAEAQLPKFPPLQGDAAKRVRTSAQRAPR